ncbi:hypothetical protein ACH5RR_022539 [Cinchona calisaya]|uniref:Late blight resistance protein R1A-like N-terminal domain-containing protein n=1 Tax=Cinchona calisaya TaxID=153742 RepID=A0ABD2Z838_9GENT
MPATVGGGSTKSIFGNMIRRMERILFHSELKNFVSLVYSFTQDLKSAYLRCHCLPSDPSNSERELARCRETIKLFLQKDVGESGITLLDYYSLGDDGDGQLTMDFIDSLLQNLHHFLVKLRNRGQELINFEQTLETLGEKLKFLKSFIGFAALQGVERKQLIDLLIHVEDVAVNAAKLICLCWWLEGDDDEQDCNEMRAEVSQLIHKKINPVDPQVRETYIHVLTASKLSRSLSQALALETNKHLVAEDFIDCLLDNLKDILEGSSSKFRFSVKDQCKNSLREQDSLVSFSGSR